MNAVELFHKDGHSAGVYYCGECRQVHSSNHTIEECCKPYKCKQCGEECKQYHTICDACERVEIARKERERFEKAEKVAESEWDGWVYCEGTGNDGFSESVDALIESCKDDEIDVPEYAWVCNPKQFATLDIDDIKSLISDRQEAYRDFDPDDLNGLEDLKKALDAFNEANAAIVSYSPDYKRAVIIKK